MTDDKSQSIDELFERGFFHDIYVEALRLKKENTDALKMIEGMAVALEYIGKTGVMAFNISQVAEVALESYRKFKGE